MRLVGIESVAPDTVLAKNVYGGEGILLLRQGTPLRAEYLKRMKDLGYFGTVINDEMSAGIDVPDVIPEELRREAIDIIRGLYFPTVKEKGLFLQSAKIFKLADKLIDEVISLRSSILNLRDLKTLGEYLYQHSVNVAVLSIFLGKEMGLNNDALRDLSRAALLHDIGMATLDKNILSKPSALSNDEMKCVMTHPTVGFDLLKEHMRINTVSYVAVLQHHERYDKAGYPNHRGGEDIGTLARIIAVADCYDAMTSTRYHRMAYSPSDAYEYIIGNSGAQFDPKVVSVFAKKVAPFAAGSTVRLSDSRMAIVLENNSSFILRPIIRVIEDDNSFSMIDMARDSLNLTITNVV